MISPFVDIDWVREHRGEIVLADSRWYPDGRSGRDAYAAGHAPGAVFVDFDTVLSAHGDPALGGRHPLPDPDDFAAAMTALGIGDDDTVIPYDDAGGVIAARLVWMLRVTDHEAALLDGGLAAWDGELETTTPTDAVTPTSAGSSPVDSKSADLGPVDLASGGSGPVDLKSADSGVVDLRSGSRTEGRPHDGTRAQGPPQAGDGSASPAVFTARPWPAERLATIEEAAELAAAGGTVIDARPAERFAGEPDDLDPRAGHIPGARSVPCRANVDSDGRLLSATELRERFAVEDAGEAISYCGSGVTACHNLLAMEAAGLGIGRLFPGSWSQWSRDPERPVQTGRE